MCENVPIIVRATTSTSILQATARIAAHNTLSTQHPVYIVGCWGKNAREPSLPPSVFTISMADHLACRPEFREDAYRNPRARARLARW